MLKRRDVLAGLGMSSAFGLLSSRSGRTDARVARTRSNAHPPGGPRQGQSIRVPFTHFRRDGEVTVRYAVTVNPDAVGFDIVPDLGLEAGQCRGYPTLHAVIERYGGTGYRTICGWIQIVTAQYYRSESENEPPTRISASVDQFPSMIGIDMPFAVVGFLPELFDAPCGNRNGYARLRWTADSFLTSVPLKSRTEPIRCLAGLRWGYTSESAGPRSQVSSLPLSVTGGHAWNAHLPLLRERFHDWRFAGG